MQPHSTTLRVSLFLTPIIALLLATNVAGQNLADWSRQFDCNQQHDTFNDIFAVSDGGYITCGESGDEVLLVKMNGNGETEWMRTYGNGTFDAVWTLIETEDGNFLVGMERGENFSALHVDSHGEVIWWNDYDVGICHALIELKGGDFILVGHGNGNQYRAGRLIKVNGQGEVIWDKLYDPGYCDLYSLRETDGGIVITGTIGNVRPWATAYRVCLVKFDYEGELIWASSFRPQNNSIGRGVINSPDGGYAITGYCSNDENIQSGGQIFLIKTNHNGDLSWQRTIPKESNNCLESGWSILRPEAGGYAIVGQTRDLIRNRANLKMVRATDEGVVAWKRLFGIGIGLDGESQRLMFYSVIRGHDNSILAAGNNNNPGEGLNGFIVKLTPRGVEPMRITYEPLDTTLVLFPQDAVRFTVHVQGEITGAISYLWTHNDVGFSTDSTTVVRFEDLGEHKVSCYVADEESQGSVTWNILVDDLFIAKSSPDERHLQLHRGTTQVFSIDSVATYAPQEDLVYSWSYMREDGQMMGEYYGDDAVSITFNRVGQYIVKGTVSLGNESDAVEWLVDVHGLIWSYEPRQNTFNILPDTRVPFRLIPLVSEPANVFSWYLDGDLKAGGDESIYTAQLSERREFQLIGFLSNGNEVDSVVWNIRVGSLTTPEDDDSILPLSTGIQSVSPNPFNSMVKLTYTVRQASLPVRLTIHDIAGRELATLVDGQVSAGTHEVVFEGTTLTAGIYYARLGMGAEVQTVKMLLVR